MQPVYNHNLVSRYQAILEKLSKLIRMKSRMQSNDSELRMNGIRNQLQMLQIGPDDLQKLPVIHVTGTKGKGSTCALIESILRRHGFFTGFFSSPHLIDVRERIRLNGVPISMQKFSDYFDFVYGTLSVNCQEGENVPFYFRFLTILALYTFLKEKIDIAIIEVGIGGEFDCTNVVTNVPVCAITSLGLDHCNLLGNTIEEIASQKAGIIKPNTYTLTVQNQPEEALAVIKERALQKNSTVEIVPNLMDTLEPDRNQMNSMCFRNEALKLNASLATKVTYKYLEKQQYFPKNVTFNDFFNDNRTLSGLLNCNWPGRYHHLKYKNINFYLDGAHTDESILLCVEWFKKMTGATKSHPTYLLFNVTGNRSFDKKLLSLSQIEFDCVIFLSNIVDDDPNSSLKSHISYHVATTEQLTKCYENEEYWKSNIDSPSTTMVIPSIKKTLQFLLEHSDNNKIDVLVTGSLVLVGNLLSVIQPNICDECHSESL